MRSDGQKVLLAIKNMGGERKRSGLAGLAGQPGLARLEDAGTRHRRRRFRPGQGGWRRSGPMCRFSAARCTSTVISSLTRLTGCMRRSRADYNDMVYAARPAKRSGGQTESLHPKMAAQMLRAVADSLEEAGDRLFTFARFPQCQCGSRSEPRTPSNACTREFKRRIKTQTVLPSAETAAMLFWALLASGQMIVMRKVDGWKTLARKAFTIRLLTS